MRSYVIMVDEHENGEVDVNVLETKTGGFSESEVKMNDNVIDALSSVLKRYFVEDTLIG